MQPEIRITGLSLCGSSLQCGGVFLILKLLLCIGEVTAKEHTGLRHFFLKLSLTAMIK
jgi:hypothetical protein